MICVARVEQTPPSVSNKDAIIQLGKRHLTSKVAAEQGENPKLRFPVIVRMSSIT